MGEIYYGIEVANVLVTSENCNNITGYRIKGSVSYNPDTNTLTLDNAMINGFIGFGYGSDRLKEITITLIGVNTINYWIDSVIETKVINGTGSLRILNGAIKCDEYNTIVQNCTISIVTNNYFNTLWNKSIAGIADNKLTIKNANLFIQSKDVAIGPFTSIELVGCEIVEPANAQIIDKEFKGLAGKFICNENGTVAKGVVIKNEQNK